MPVTLGFIIELHSYRQIVTFFLFEFNIYAFKNVFPTGKKPLSLMILLFNISCGVYIHKRIYILEMYLQYLFSFEYYIQCLILGFIIEPYSEGRCLLL